MLTMKHLIATICVLSLCFASSQGAFAEDDTQHGPNPQALAQFDDSVNGSTQLVDDIPKANREEIMAEHKENEDWAFYDDMYGIDNELWYEHARREGWLNND
jgi:hypothetical protein